MEICNIVGKQKIIGTRYLMQKMTMEKLLKGIHNFFAGTSKQARIFRAASLLSQLTGLVFLHRGRETRRGHGPRTPYGLRRDWSWLSCITRILGRLRARYLCSIIDDVLRRFSADRRALLIGPGRRRRGCGACSSCWAGQRAAIDLDLSGEICGHISTWTFAA